MNDGEHDTAEQEPGKFSNREAILAPQFRYPVFVEQGQIRVNETTV